MLENLPIILQTGVIIVVAGVYLLSVGRKEKERISDEKINETFDRQDKIIESLKQQSEEQDKELAKLKAENQEYKLKVQSLEGEVERWKDAATNKTAINEVRGILAQFQAMQPEQQKVVSDFRDQMNTLINQNQELREMTRDDRKATERLEKLVERMDKSIAENSVIIRKHVKDVDEHIKKGQSKKRDPEAHASQASSEH